MLYDQLKTHISDVVKKVYSVELEEVSLEHPANEKFGDISTSISFKLASEIKQSPDEIARKLAYEIQSVLEENHGALKKQLNIEKVEALSPGFINFFFDDDWLLNLPSKVLKDGKNYGSSKYWNAKKVIVEFTDPNPFKVFHIGHLMTNTIGESLARIYEFTGADVRRANYQGDIGMHVAKSIWGLVKNMADDDISLSDLEKKTLDERIEYLGKGYARGAKSFEEDKNIVEEVTSLNIICYHVAQKLNEKTHKVKGKVDYEKLLLSNKSPADIEIVEKLFIEGRKWSLEYFETLYKRLGTKFDFYYFESEVAEQGYSLVKENLENGVFDEDNGAIIYRGEADGLHTRVFINSLGLPVYEAKDLGLAFMKHRDFKYDSSLIITNNEVDAYFEVVLKALAKINPDLASKTVHLGHGSMKFTHGKMSSRTGDVVAGDKLLNDLRDYTLEKISVSEHIKADRGLQLETADRIAVASMKYNILKNGIGTDIVYDKDDVLNLTGNTGLYLLYTFARANSVIDAGGKDINFKPDNGYELQPQEESILRHIYKFEEVVTAASERLAPNLVATFIFELAQRFNLLYAELSILKAESQDQKKFRLAISCAVKQVIENGLNLLGAKVVDRM